MNNSLFLPGILYRVKEEFPFRHCEDVFITQRLSHINEIIFVIDVVQFNNGINGNEMYYILSYDGLYRAYLNGARIIQL